MGYCMDQSDANFCIPRNKAKDALKAIKALADKNDRFSWVSASEFKHAKSLVEAMDAWRWNLSAEDEGEDYTSIQFEGEKLGDDLVLFKAIAPFVNEGSFIEMHGEDGSIWRWTFDGTTCKEVSPTITW